VHAERRKADEQGVHLTLTGEMNLASTRRNWPTVRGFERFYGSLATPRTTRRGSGSSGTPASPTWARGDARADAGPAGRSDVSGEPYLDLERQAVAMLARK
jgi:hypothetical protein